MSMQAQSVFLFSPNKQPSGSPYVTQTIILNALSRLWVRNFVFNVMQQRKFASQY